MNDLYIYIYIYIYIGSSSVLVNVRLSLYIVNWSCIHLQLFVDFSTHAIVWDSAYPKVTCPWSNANCYERSWNCLLCLQNKNTLSWNSDEMTSQRSLFFFPISDDQLLHRWKRIAPANFNGHHLHAKGILRNEIQEWKMRSDWWTDWFSIIFTF